MVLKELIFWVGVITVFNCTLGGCDGFERTDF